MEQEQLELAALKHLVQTEEVKEKLKRKRTGLRLAYFEKSGTQQTVSWVVNYANRYKQAPPSADALLAFIGQEINNMEEPLKSWCEQTARQVFEPPAPAEDFAFYVDQLSINWRKRMGINGLDGALLELNKGNFDEFTGQLNETSRKIQLASEVLPNVYPIDDYPHILADLKYRAEHRDEFQKIPTGIRWLDERLGGGWSLGEYYLLFSYTGRGKSFFGTQCAFYAVWAGFNVAIANLEMTNSKARNRMLSRITGIPTIRFMEPWELTTQNYEIWEQKMAEWKEAKGNMVFLSFEKIPTVDDIVAKLHNLPFQPDLLILDQITEMSTRLEWQELEVVAKQLEFTAKSWDKERGLSILTFGQSTRDTKWYAALTEQHFAYGKPVCEHATGVMYLSQTETDFERNIIRLGMCKHRDGEPVPEQFFMYPDRARARIHCAERYEREGEANGNPF